MKPRASRIADMVASVPDDTSRTCSTGGTLATISSASSDLARARRAERQPAGRGRRRTASSTAGMGVPEDHRPPGADQIDVACCRPRR